MTSPAPTAADPAARPSRLAHRRAGRAWRWLRWPLALGAVLTILGLAAVAYVYSTVALPEDPPELRSSVVLDARGRELAAFQRGGLRVEADLDEVAPVVVEALIAAEDRRFYEHGGVDPVGIVRAFTSNIRGEATQGASTITQQLVKNTYLDSERTYSRKVKEAVLAIKLERTEDKDVILERYLNTVYFGRGAYGIEAAAEIYFDTTAAELTTAQAALLVGLLRAPASADPTTDPDAARARRAGVLTDLVEVGDLTRAEAARARGLPLGATPLKSPVTLRAGVAAHAVEWIRQQAIERFGESVVYGGGLRITSTLDLDDQRAAEQAIATVLPDPADPEAALVAVDRDGGVKAFVGGRDHRASKVDLARGEAGGGGGRQPGSTFKPVVLATALEQRKATLATRYPGPATVTVDVAGTPYTVDNYDGDGFGQLDLVDATAESVNTVYAQLMADVGPQAVVPLAERLGITSELEAHPSLVLGAEEVSVLDMTTTFLTFAREGDRVEPFVIERVEDGDGDVVFRHDRGDGERAIAEGTARGVTHALRAVVERGTGTAARLDRPAAGKTGTTQGNGDAWFAGYTPNYAAVVWMGYPEGPQRQMIDVHGRAVTGGSFPAEIWKRFMDGALADVEPADFAPPPEDLLRPLSRPERHTTTSTTAPTTSAPTTTTTTTAPPTSTTTTSAPSTTAPTTTTTTAPPTTLPPTTVPPTTTPPTTAPTPPPLTTPPGPEGAGAPAPGPGD